ARLGGCAGGALSVSGEGGLGLRQAGAGDRAAGSRQRKTVAGEALLRRIGRPQPVDARALFLVDGIEQPRGVEAEAVGPVERDVRRAELPGEGESFIPALGAEEPEHGLVPPLEELTGGELG